MYKIVNLTTLAALTLGAISLQSNLASAARNITSTGYQHLQQPVDSSQIGHLPHDPVPGVGSGRDPSAGDSNGGGGHNHHLGISFDTLENLDLNHLCRLVLFKHKHVRICYVP